MIKDFRRGSVYQVAVAAALMLISVNVFVKGIIWPFALKGGPHDVRRYPVYIRNRFGDPVRYTTENKQKLLKGSEHLLTGAVIIFFTTLAFRLAKTANIFDEEE